MFNDQKNIFISYDNCYHLNINCKQNCFCEYKDKNIHKICFDQNIFFHETFVYLQLIDTNIITPISTDKFTIIYHVNHLITLRQYMLEYPSFNSLLLNEVFSFIYSFKKYNFIHGNPHIDNIYIELDEKNYFKNFYVIDLANSYINFDINSNINFDINSNINLDINSNINFEFDINLKSCPYERTSFLEEYNKKNNILKYWDFLCIFTSFKIYFENHKLYYYISYIQSIITKNIGNDKFIQLMNIYHNIIEYNHYNNIKKKS